MEPVEPSAPPAGRPRLPRNVVVLSWVSFVQDAASEMLYPVLPLFLTGVLGASPAVVGLIEGVAEGTASVMKAVSGRLADARRPRQAFGFHRALDTAGAIVGPLTGLAMYQLLQHRLRPLFFVAFVPAGVSVALVGLVRERPRSPASRRRAAGGGRLSMPYWRVVGFSRCSGWSTSPTPCCCCAPASWGSASLGWWVPTRCTTPAMRR